jgi:hypothetical protein
MARTSRLLLLALIAIGSFTAFASDLRPSPRPGDPALDGKEYLISEADFRAVLAVARAWLTRTHPSFSVRRVHVVTHDSVEVYVRGRLNSSYNQDSDLHSLDLQRSKTSWRITTHNLNAAPTID